MFLSDQSIDRNFGCKPEQRALQGRQSLNPASQAIYQALQSSASLGYYFWINPKEGKV